MQETLALIFSFLALLLSGVSIVFARATARRWRTYTRSDPQPICGCKHHASFHDDSGCHYIDVDPYARSHPECGCVKYLGPEPVPEYLP